MKVFKMKLEKEENMIQKIYHMNLMDLFMLDKTFLHKESKKIISYLFKLVIGLLMK